MSDKEHLYTQLMVLGTIKTVNWVNLFPKSNLAENKETWHNYSLQDQQFFLFLFYTFFLFCVNLYLQNYITVTKYWKYKWCFKAHRQISKKQCLEKYCSCDKACQFPALQGAPNYLKNTTTDDKFINKFLYIKDVSKVLRCLRASMVA